VEFGSNAAFDITVPFDVDLCSGWHFNPDRESMHFDLKWTIKSHELKQDQLQPWQLTNHFLRNTVLTTKVWRLWVRLVCSSRLRTSLILV
jgi:hypothetical protein